MKKILFVGAGMAALVAAEKLGRSGKYEVTVLEKNARENISYDWHDDVNRAAFEKNGLPMPLEGTYFVKRNWTFIPPSESVEVTLDIPEEELDLSIERRKLAQQYISRAEDVVDFRFSTQADSLIFEGDRVVGVRAGEEKFYADLVVDNSGAMSKLRAQLPEDSGVTKQPNDDEIFVAYRAFMKSADGAPSPKNTNRAYLKHLGETGISWSILDPSGSVNVLIGRVGSLPKETFIGAFRALKASNPNISDEIVRGGIICKIPIRHPLSRMVADGYVAIGDSAFMTIPMIGSGIQNSIDAACILADVILKNDSPLKQALWEYQVRYYLEKGADHMGVDVLKRWLLSAYPKDLDWLFEKGVVGEKEMEAGATGQLVKLSFSDLLSKLKKGISRLPLLFKLNGVIQKSARAAKIGRRIPKTFDEKAVCRWQRRVESLYR